MAILVTGAAGFIGFNFVLDWFSQSEDVISFDLLSNAGNLENLSTLDKNPRHHFVHRNIGNRALNFRTLKKYQIRAIVDFASTTP
jgi:dTDP-glucose 4,6-dehydratase